MHVWVCVCVCVHARMCECSQDFYNTKIHIQIIWNNNAIFKFT